MSQRDWCCEESRCATRNRAPCDASGCQSHPRGSPVVLEHRLPVPGVCDPPARDATLMWPRTRRVNGWRSGATATRRIATRNLRVPGKQFAVRDRRNADAGHVVQHRGWVALSTLTGNDRTRLASSQKVRVMPLLIATSYPLPRASTRPAAAPPVRGGRPESGGGRRVFAVERHDATRHAILRIQLRKRRKPCRATAI